MMCLICKTDFSPQGLTVYPTHSMWLLFDKGWPKQIFFCDRCFSGVARPLPSEDYLNKFYDSSQYWHNIKPVIRPQRQPVMLAQARARWRLIKPHLELRADRLSLLDVGAGYGYLGIVSAADFYTAVEPDPHLRRALEDAWATWGLDSFLNTSAKIDCLAEGYEAPPKFHIVAVSHILEHVRDPARMIEDAASFLEDDGRLFIEVPYRDDLFKADVFPHLHFFSLNGMEMLIKNAKLEILDLGTWGQPMHLSPLNHNAPRSVRVKGKVLDLATRFLPSVISSSLFSWHFGINARNKLGTWIRAIAKKC